MNTMPTFEDQIVRYLQDGPVDLPLEQREAIASAAERLPQRRAGISWPGLAPSRRVQVGLAAGVLIAATALALPRLDPSTIGGPDPTATPTATPTASSTLLHWTPDAFRTAPYPGPLREEPSGRAQAVDDTVTTSTDGRVLHAGIDPVGDGLPTVDPRVDLVNVEYGRETGCAPMRTGTLCVYYAPAQLLEMPLANAVDEWIAYGVVLDRDRDGRPDGRFGIDNGMAGAVRAWHSDLATGRFQAVIGGNGRTIDGFYGESELPSAPGPRAYISLTQGLTSAPPNWDGGFYFWAALIREGRIVSLDFAPDEGWLIAPPSVVAP